VFSVLRCTLLSKRRLLLWFCFICLCITKPLLITFLCITSELNIEFPAEWSRDSLYDATFTAPGGEYNISEAWLLSSPPLPSRQVHKADSSWIKFLFIRKTSLQVQDIWRGGEFSKWLLSPLDQKSFQELVFKEFKNRKPSGYVDRQQVRSTDRNLFFFKLKLLFFDDDDSCEWGQQR